MAGSLGAFLPEELLEGILVRLDESAGAAFPGPTPKPGLASCSQTCRHWASFIRPLLWRSITLRSRDDDVVFSELIGAPNFLAVSIKSCLLRVIREYDGPLSTIPSFISLPVIPAISSGPFATVEWTIREEVLPTRASSPVFPCAVLPRMPPRNALQVDTLTIHGIHRLSIRNFVRFLRSLRISTLVLREITFVDESELDTIRPSSSPRRPRCDDFELELYRCIKQAGSLPFWLKFCELVVGGQCPPARFSEANDLALQSFIRCLDSQPGRHEPLSLLISSGYRYADEPVLIKVKNPHRDPLWQYSLGGDSLLADLCIVCPEHNDLILESSRYQFPAMRGTDLISAVGQLWDTLIRDSAIPSNVFTIDSETEEAFHDLLSAVLEGRLFTHGPAHRVGVAIKNWVRYTTGEILRAPTTVVSEDGTELELATERRVEALLFPSPGQSVQTRLEELRRMQCVLEQE